MLRKVSIGWLKQRSGSFALKGITISEGDYAFDSSNSFREQDAEWLTTTLNAQADVEFSGRKEHVQASEGYPKWASRSVQASSADAIAPISLERANATLLRHLLSEIVAASGGELDAARLEKLARDADTLLRSTDCGTYYSLDDALSILTKFDKKPRAGKVGT